MCMGRKGCAQWKRHVASLNVVLIVALIVAVAVLQPIAAAEDGTQASSSPDVHPAAHGPVFECGEEEVTELKLNRTVQCNVSSIDAPRLFCYRAPQFNVWRAFCEVSFTVSSHKGVIPFVHSAAEDSLHGIIDNHVKVAPFPLSLNAAALSMCWKCMNCKRVVRR